MTKNIHENVNDLSIERLVHLKEKIQTSDDNHQLEFVRKHKELTFVNDAKSIRTTATRYSLEAMQTSVVLILGGKNTVSDYFVLANKIKQKVVAIVYLGDNSNDILSFLTSKKMFFAKASSIDEAVQIASVIGRSGNVVLFSPACQCVEENYKVRGNEFKQAVQKL